MANSADGFAGLHEVFDEGHGFPGTMATDFYDYMIADKIVMPEAIRPLYAEKIAYLPDSFQANDTSRITGEPPSRSELGLPKQAFVFCCFNNSFKITPDVFDIWMRILQRVESSVLWLLEDNSAAVVNLRAEAERRGVASHRLIFAPRAPHGAHMARHRAADLFLDTLPYNAHTTASDALWMGLPLLTCLGDSFAGRVAASVLTALELPELIAASPDDYEARAVALATNPLELARVKQKLAENRFTKPLFNVKRYARYIERAFTQMYARYQAGQPPEDIHIDP